MRLLLSFFIAFSLCVSSYSASKDSSWLKTFEADYPKNKYLAQTGSGPTELDAKSQALANIASYLKSSVESTTTSSVQVTAVNSSLSKTHSSQTDTVIKTDITLSSVQYTPAFYDKKKKTYTVGAYITREEAWSKQDILTKNLCDVFISMYDKGCEIKDSDPFTALMYLKQSQIFAKDFIEELNILTVILPEKTSSAYINQKTQALSINALIKETSLKCSIYISLSKKDNGIITGEVEQVLKAAGFTVTQDKNAPYRAELTINENKSEWKDEDTVIYSFTPSMTLAIKNNGKTLYTWTSRSTEKTVSYNENKGYTKSITLLGGIIKSDLQQDLKTFLENR